MATYQLNINGQRSEVTTDPSTPLLWVLREDLKMTGTKYGCGVSACGACTVHVAGVATRSCMVPVSMIGDRPRSRRQGGAGRLGVSRRRAMWLLPERTDHERGRAPQAHAQPD